jgi:hypothetical protein
MTTITKEWDMKSIKYELRYIRDRKFRHGVKKAQMKLFLPKDSFIIHWYQVDAGGSLILKSKTIKAGVLKIRGWPQPAPFQRAPEWKIKRWPQPAPKPRVCVCVCCVPDLD